MLDSEAIKFFFPCLCDLLAGNGLSSLLLFGSLPTTVTVIVWTAMSMIMSFAFQFYRPCQKPPTLWLSFFQVTFSLILTLSQFFQLMGQLSEDGDQLALIPTFLMLCISRVGPFQRGITTLGSLSFIVACILIISVRASRTDLLVYSGGYWEQLVGWTWDTPKQEWVSTNNPYWYFNSTAQNTNVDINMGSTVELLVTVFFCTSFNTMDVLDERLLHCNTGTAVLFGNFVKSLVLFAYVCSDNAVIYSLLAGVGTSDIYKVIYGMILLLAGMQYAAWWFALLKAFTGKSRNIVRTQHILNALLVACAFYYPIRIHLLRTFILSFLMAASVVYRLTR